VLAGDIFSKNSCISSDKKSLAALAREVKTVCTSSSSKVPCSNLLNELRLKEFVRGVNLAGSKDSFPTSLLNDDAQDIKLDPAPSQLLLLMDDLLLLERLCGLVGWRQG
jgi:hypothetical protein